MEQRYEKIGGKRGDGVYITSFCMKYITIYPGQTPDLSRLNFKFIEEKQSFFCNRLVDKT